MSKQRERPESSGALSAQSLLPHVSEICSVVWGSNHLFSKTEQRLNSYAYSDPKMTLRQDDSSMRTSSTAEKTDPACPVATLHHATNHSGKLSAKGHMCTLRCGFLPCP
ncbi:hypothetical protein I79_005226 [Cricetulus griseus]|uniref:Uncharacterized protein n=1 Tax=Cricetulus griseus TaxID=10029 RepID=G3H4M1_CRIGR|nr:hypothetical protein I79_005226 [Cricetulus griseus]ERE92779.1 hypothetical protein H671_1g0026 [Cricetulus griseus]